MTGSRTMSSFSGDDDDDDSLTVCRVSELEPGDWVSSGTNLGNVTTADNLRVKGIRRAEQGRYAVTLARAGTIFVNGDLIVELCEP